MLSCANCNYINLYFYCYGCGLENDINTHNSGFTPTQKHLRTKVTPDLHLTYIRTHLAYMYLANAKKVCYIKQQSHSSESKRWQSSVATEKMMSVMALDGVKSF